MKKFNRKVYLIKPEFQLPFVAYFATCFFIAILTIVGAINYFFYKFTQLGIEAKLDQDHIFFQFLNDQQVYMNMLIAVVAVVIMLFIFLGGIFLSHKIAGPIHRFCSDLSNMNKENLKEIHVRDKDFFQEMFENFNDFLKRL